MNCPIGTVRSRIFRAREAIAAELRPLLGPMGPEMMMAKPEEISLLMDGELEAERIDSVCAGLRESQCVATWCATT